MRRKNKKREGVNDAHVDMTPMLDIIFILLIFFIVTTSFVKDKGFLVEKVEESQAQASSVKNITIHIDENNTIYFNNKIVDIERIPARVESFISNHPTDKILFRPHKETNYQNVVDVLDQIKPFKRLKINIGIYTP